MRVVFFIGVLFLSGYAIAQAQQAKSPFSDPKNLKVLPKDISSGELREIMRGFSFATGIRCSGCHVAEPGAPLSEWDFSLDEKKQKRIARDMLKMTAIINRHVTDIEGVKASDAVAVRCMTCHRGQNRPLLIQDVLDQYKTKNDAIGAVTHYREIRETYYGTHTYDFSPFTLGNYAENIMKEGSSEFAFALHDLNRELNPEDGLVFMAWGNSLMQVGKFAEALAAYQTAARLEPENTFIASLVKRAEGSLNTD